MTMNRCLRFLLGVALLAALPASATHAAEAAQVEDSEAAILAEMRTLNKSLQEMSGLLKDFLENQRFEVLMKRIEFKTKALAEAERALQGLTESRAAEASRILQLETNLKELSAELEMAREQDVEGGARLEEIFEVRRDDITSQLKLAKQKASDLDLRVIEMENQVFQRRDEIQGWEEYLDRQLELR